MADFTKGPWRVAKVVDSKFPKPHIVYVLIDDGRKRNVCAVSVYGRNENNKPTKMRKELGEMRAAPSIGNDECMANARLIARAPSMLALLEKALPIIEAEAEMRECGPHCDSSTTEEYEREMREIANEIAQEIDRARGKGASDE
jgi:hypothetical protein